MVEDDGIYLLSMYISPVQSMTSPTDFYTLSIYRLGVEPYVGAVMAVAEEVEFEDDSFDLFSERNSEVVRIPTVF